MVVPTLPDPFLQIVLAAWRKELLQSGLERIIADNIEGNDGNQVLETSPIINCVTPICKNYEGVVDLDHLCDAIVTQARQSIPIFSWLKPRLKEYGCELKDDHYLLSDGMGYGHYATITLPSSNKQLPVNVSFRVKYHERLLEKFAANLILRALGFEAGIAIHDIGAMRITLGPTGGLPRDQRPRILTPETFSHQNSVFDTIVAFETHGIESTYFSGHPGEAPPSERVQMIQGYHRKCMILLKAIRAEDKMFFTTGQIGSYMDMYNLFLEKSIELAESDRGYIHHDHLEELVLQRIMMDIFIQSTRHYGMEPEIRDYVLQPSDTGYMAVHLICPIPYGFMWDMVEIQMRTGPQHASSYTFGQWDKEMYDAKTRPYRKILASLFQLFARVFPSHDEQVAERLLTYFDHYRNRQGCPEIRFVNFQES